MRQAHIGNAEFAGIPALFAQSCASISTLEATMSLLSFLRTSLLDLAERKLGLFFQHSRRLRRRARNAASAGDAASVMALA
jgi:chorismate-pyruvate lyase